MKKLAEFDGNAKKMQHFVLNYMKQFEMILLFVRSTRQQDLQLHMESLEYLTKYLFAHDHQNYARSLRLYTSTMPETERQHPDLWAEFMKGNFCVTKGVAGFTSIAPDQGIEQENRTLEVIGGIVGITQNEKALDKLFLIAPELSKLLYEFAAEYGSDNNDKRTQHHKIAGGKLSRMMKNTREHGDPFMTPDDEDEIYNLLTKEVMTETVSQDTLERDEIGQRKFVEFATERLTQGRLCVWDKMTKKKLKTFKTANATIEINAGGQLVKIKEERGLLQRLIVISINRPQLDPKECIGTYEFGVIPRSLFASDGTVLLAYDKAKILRHLELVVSNEQQVRQTPAMETSTSVTSNNENGQEIEASEIAHAPDLTREGFSGLNDTSPTYKVIIIDGMALVNAIPKTERIKTCKYFAQVFLDQLSNMAGDYDEVRLVFDRYINSSLKEQMRRKRTKGKSTYYHVKDTTLIQNISLKDFLSNIKTKAELITYLAEKTTDHSKGPTNKLKKSIVTSVTETRGNICVPSTMVTHSQEGGGHLTPVARLSIDRHAEVVIASPDTDVFLLMIQMYPSLSCDISFLTDKGNLKRSIPVQPVYNMLGHKRASAIGSTRLPCSNRIGHVWTICRANQRMVLQSVYGL